MWHTSQCQSQTSWCSNPFFSLPPGTWEKTFDPELTTEEDFHINATTTVRVPMMTRLGVFDVFYCSTLASQVLLMPYQGNVTALFFLPDDGKLQHLEKTLNKELIAKFLVKEERR